MDCIAFATISHRSMVDPGRGAEQDHSVLRAEVRRQLCHVYSRRQLLANADIAASRGG